jgi:hypothetical protein
MAYQVVEKPPYFKKDAKPAQNRGRNELKGNQVFSKLASLKQLKTLI